MALALQQGGMTMPVDLICLTSQERDALISAAQSDCSLSDDEVIIYAAIFDAAERGKCCPTGEDLNELTGRTSDSASRNVVMRLEEKGLIFVSRYQRFRRVQIVATGKWTARSPSMHVERPHVPRGARRAVATDRKPYKGRLG